MRCFEFPKPRNGFTLLELFILVVISAILTVILLPTLRPAHVCCYPNCASNLKQIGLAFKTWSLDNGDRFPMSVPTKEGGTMELGGGANAFAHFSVMSNELSTPKVLVCPEDKKRMWATNFDSDLNNFKLSYFVGLDASQTRPTMWLSGDRNLTNKSALNGIVLVRPGDAVGWTAEMHKAKGHILLADGSVQLANGSFENAASRALTNRLAMP